MAKRKWVEKDQRSDQRVYNFEIRTLSSPQGLLDTLSVVATSLEEAVKKIEKQTRYMAGVAGGDWREGYHFYSKVEVIAMDIIT